MKLNEIKEINYGTAQEIPRHCTPAHTTALGFEEKFQIILSAFSEPTLTRPQLQAVQHNLLSLS